MQRLVVIDTCAVISYYPKVFQEESTISKGSLELISAALGHSDVRIIIPTIVFVELFQLYFKREEMSRLIYYEVYLPFRDSPHFELRGFDQDGLNAFITIDDIEPDQKFDNHDKQVLSAAISMNCPLMTSDTKIKRYNDRKSVIPAILD